jgi:uncharacterized MAPEG superfamily protein
VLVVSLAGDVKQSAKGGYSINYTFTRLLWQATYYLTSKFFRTLMWYFSSARSIMQS